MIRTLSAVNTLPAHRAANIQNSLQAPRCMGFRWKPFSITIKFTIFEITDTDKLRQNDDTDKKQTDHSKHRAAPKGRSSQH